MKQNEKLTLPIDPYIQKIIDTTSNYSTVMVKASPGSGKTTRLPWALAKGLSKKVVVLEPRRLAAKLAALRICEEEGRTIGQEVGYHFRFEKNISENTQVIFYTEGTFLKKFLQDPLLKDVDIVVLDEFHERHLETDLALALLRELQTKRDIKIVLMSATLDMALLNLFPDSNSIEIEAAIYPVELHYLPNQPSILNQSLEAKVKKAVEESSGDTLVFLPGMREMMKVQSVLHGNYEVFLLHADLSKEEQSMALGPCSKRKIILSTNIAESSVTIPGIKVVIDAGIQREAHYSPWNGLKLVQDSPVTKSSAIQRAGRAGRTGPGSCYRLYSQQDFNERPDHTVPEIERADLTDIYLLVAGTGLSPLWFHAPSPEKWKKAHDLLVNLGAIENSKITPMGRKILEFPLDSRLARILIEGEDLPLKSKENLLRYICEEIEEDRSGTLKRRLQFYLKKHGENTKAWEQCLLTGFVDQLARFREKQRDFIHYSGKILKAHASLNLQDGYYIVFDITQRQEAIKVMDVHDEWLWEVDPFPFVEEDEIQMDDKISIRRKTKLGSIVVEEMPVRLLWNELSAPLKTKIAELSQSRVKNSINSWRETPDFERLSFLARKQGIDLNKTFSKINVADYFETETNLSWENFPYFLKNVLEAKLDVSNIDRELPFKMNLGGRRELVIHYPEGMDPYLEAPIQDFYGLNETPSIMNGKVPLQLKLLGPHKRPIQVTKDLKNFWQNTYQEMKKEYQRDYPRHYWPDKPWEAKPFLLKSHLPKT